MYAIRSYYVIGREIFSVNPFLEKPVKAGAVFRLHESLEFLGRDAAVGGEVLAAEILAHGGEELVVSHDSAQHMA